jgi:hypothetical protein
VAELPAPELRFTGGCPDCGERRVALPEPPPPVGEDFAWDARDFDGLRLAMLEDLAARAPQRERWTVADLEVVLVEAFAAVLEQLTDMHDRVSAEAYLETARQPASVLRLLRLIGYDAVAVAQDEGALTPDDGADELLRHWARQPDALEAARREGPRAIRSQRRAVTPEDYAVRLAEHPLVRRASAWSEWSGAWQVIRVALITRGNAGLDRTGVDFGDVRDEVEGFHLRRRLRPPAWGPRTTVRGILVPLIDAYRLAGQEVWLQDAQRVPVFIALSVRIAPEYFQSEVRRAVAQALGTGPGGLFEPGRLRFGEDLHESDLVQALTALEGVEEVCLNRFKRLGRRHPDERATGRIALEGTEIAACDNDPERPTDGYYTLRLHGGRRG